MAATGKLPPSAAEAYVRAEMKVLLAPARVCGAAVSSKREDGGPAPRACLSSAIRRYVGVGGVSRAPDADADAAAAIEPDNAAAAPDADAAAPDAARPAAAPAAAGAEERPRTRSLSDDWVEVEQSRSSSDEVEVEEVPVEPAPAASPPPPPSSPAPAPPVAAPPPARSPLESAIADATAPPARPPPETAIADATARAPAAAAAPARKRPARSKLRGGFFSGAKAKKGGLLGTRDASPPKRAAPRGFVDPRESDKQNPDYAKFGEEVQAMREQGLSETQITARLKASFERHATPLQRKAEEYGVKLAKQGHTEEYVRDKLTEYIENVRKFEREFGDADDA